VLDQWFAGEVQPRLKGRAYIVRYADDFVIGFTDDEDARRVMAVLPKRLLTFRKVKQRLEPG
jgi:RNA-directed DNA polymerase